MTKNKIVKRLNPDEKVVKIPLKSFKPHVRVVPLDDAAVDPKLMAMMRQYQKRGSDLMSTLDQMNQIKEDREEREEKRLEAEQDKEWSEEFMRARNASLPADVVQQIVKDEKFDDSRFDNKPKQEILTREQVLEKIRIRNDSNK